MSLHNKYPPSCRIFIGNIDNNVVTKQVLRDIFEKYGQIQEDIRLHKGYAFIQYDNEASAVAALTAENDRQLEIEISKGGKKGEEVLAQAAAVGLPLPALTAQQLGKRKPDFGNAGFGPKRSKFNSGASAPRSVLTPTTTAALPLVTPSALRLGTYQPVVNNPPFKAVSVVVPIYVLSQELADYAGRVSYTFSSNGIESKIQFIDENILVEIIEQSSRSNMYKSQPYTIILKKKNEAEESVFFRAINQDGSSPGFADTKILDCINYILNRERPVVNSYTPSVLPQSSIYASTNIATSNPLFNQTNSYYPPAANTAASNSLETLVGSGGYNPSDLTSTSTSNRLLPPQHSTASLYNGSLSTASSSSSRDYINSVVNQAQLVLSSGNSDVTQLHSLISQMLTIIIQSQQQQQQQQQTSIPQTNSLATTPTLSQQSHLHPSATSNLSYIPESSNSYYAPQQQQVSNSNAPSSTSNSVTSPGDIKNLISSLTQIIGQTTSVAEKADS